MAGSTPIFGFPYPQDTDLVADYPALGQELATDVETVMNKRKVLQVKSTAKTDTMTTTSNTFVDITGLSVSITPQSSASKFLIIANVMGSFYRVGTNAGFIRLYRDSTAIGIPTAAGNRELVSMMPTFFDASVLSTTSATFLDSPATASAITYKVAIRTDASTIYVNRSVNDTDSANNPRGISTITVLEVAA